MTPEEKKIVKRRRFWRFAIPALLVLLFASISIMENSGMFTALRKPAENKPASVPVPFTELSVMNRLGNDGFTDNGGQLTRNGGDAGEIAFLEAGGEVVSVTYKLVTLPGDVAFGDSPYETEARAQRETDRENAGLVFRAVFEAALGGRAPAEKDLDKGEKLLDSCFSSDEEKTYTLKTDGCEITFTKAYLEGMYELTMEARRNG